MEQWLQGRSGVEIAGLVPEEDVRHAEQARDDGTAELPQVIRSELEIGDDEACGDCHQHRGAEPAKAAQVEMRKRETAVVLQFLHD